MRATRFDWDEPASHSLVLIAPGVSPVAETRNCSSFGNTGRADYS
jgi:hypothetical protein